MARDCRATATGQLLQPLSARGVPGPLKSGSAGNVARERAMLPTADRPVIARTPPLRHDQRGSRAHGLVPIAPVPIR